MVAEKSMYDVYENDELIGTFDDEEIESMTGLKRTTIYNYAAAGTVVRKSWYIELAMTPSWKKRFEKRWELTRNLILNGGR